MAQEILASGVSKVLELSITKVLEEYKLTRDVKEEIQKLKNKVDDITGLVQDAESKQLNDPESTGSVRGWLRRLKDAAYEAVDVLDDYSTEILRREVEGDHGIAAAGTLRAPAPNKVRKLLSCFITSFEEVSFRNMEAHAVKEIMVKLNGIVNEGNTLGLTKIVRQHPSLPAQNILDTSRETSHEERGPVFGRDEDKERIIKLLTGDEYSDMDASIVPIFGVGGLGKTTLARQVFKDDRVSGHFPEMKRWVYVGESFDAKKLMANILNHSLDNNKSLSDLNEDLTAKLKNCRYFIVLDDVWNNDRDEWEKLWTPLSRGGKGSKVLVTTRSLKVTQAMGIQDPTPLGILNEDDCWLILKKVAFPGGESPENFPKLEQIGRRIVKEKLGGLPLEVKTIGGLLSYRLEEDEWNKILESELWRMEQDKNGVLPALKLSCRHLSPEVRQCFGYCSVFPKGYRFDEAELINIWMGQGFILNQGNERPEDTGKRYFRDLLLISFFQPVQKLFGRCCSCVMHDRVRDLARLMSSDECIELKDNEELNVPENTCVRHLSWDSSIPESANFEKLYEFDRLRTLLIDGRLDRPLHPNSELFRKLKCLRVLHLHGRDLVMPDSIGELKHLRYLYISYWRTLELPKTMCRLYNLQTLTLAPALVLPDCDPARSLQGVTNLINLRHLKAPTHLINNIDRIGRLHHLQELDTFKVLEKGHGIEELEAMNELRGHLCILNLENVGSQALAAKAKLEKKVHLRSLELRWGDSGHVHLGGDGALDEEVLENLQPPPKLVNLSIRCYGGVQSPSWMRTQSLTNLEVIRLENCMRWQVLPPLGQVCFLKSLELIQMHQLESMPQAARSLRRLVVQDCPKLKAFPPVPSELTEMVIRNVGVEALPELQGYGGGDQITAQSSRGSSSLSSLEISDCPNLKSLRTGLLQNLSTSLSGCPQIMALTEEALGHLTGLNAMVISCCSMLVALEFRGLVSLSSLEISSCPSLTSLPEEALCHLTALKTLEIRDCEELMLLGFQSLISLEDLTIDNCPKLRATATAAPSSSMPPPPLPLRRVYLNNTITTSFFSPSLLRYFTSLEELFVVNCPQLISFTAEEEEAWKSLGSLMRLYIWSCANLQCLPAKMHSLTSLELLDIRECPQIHCFPERGLPSPLKRLYLRGCPLLEAQRER